MFSRTENFSQYIKLYPVVSIIIAINIIIHLVSLVPYLGNFIFIYGAGANYLISDGQWWRFITPMFLHAGFVHLLFNMFSLFLFGPELEKLTGKVRFLTLYFMAGLFGTVATFVLQDANYVHVGASGAIYGILGAFGGLVYYARNKLPQLSQIIVPIIIISIVMTFLTPNINITAHLTGLAVGFLIGLVFFKPKGKANVNWKNRKR
ncbi:rhomboid family intramembrane serine protease [Paenisporosarcina antarctica]|uniref:Rhomboid family intramembrane serine protease n=1 Tax=Paenisporosarcina antarctica TaxID=417367 RepID=A0A4P6ZUP7_9BACL|nr:rhomboid family intramembrane serine protease [Paenisporosarcina antarctica]QBP40041.1 rhomboid family intramembrane serine protease [Paenisporosarcina antarctica]